MGENHAMRDFRKHTGWYMSGYPGRPRGPAPVLAGVDRSASWRTCSAGLDPTARIVPGGERIKRGHTNGPIRVSLPDGWLDDHDRERLLDDVTVPDDDDVMALSGG